MFFPSSSRSALKRYKCPDTTCKVASLIFANLLGIVRPLERCWCNNWSLAQRSKCSPVDGTLACCQLWQWRFQSFWGLFQLSGRQFWLTANAHLLMWTGCCDGVQIHDREEEDAAESVFHWQHDINSNFQTNLKMSTPRNFPSTTGNKDTLHCFYNVEIIGAPCWWTFAIRFLVSIYSKQCPLYYVGFSINYY